MRECMHSDVLDESTSVAMMAMLVNAAVLAANKRKSRQCRHAGAGWSLRWLDLRPSTKHSTLPGWTELVTASPNKRLHVHAKPGAAAWPTASQLHNDWCELQSCCGSRERLPTLLNGLSEEQQGRHSCVSVSNMLAQRIRIREACATQQQFSSRMVEALQQRTTSIATGMQMATLPDGGSVCVSCYRAVVGISRASLFRKRARVSLLGLCDDIAAQRTQPPQLISAEASQTAELLASEIGREEHCKRTTDALNLQSSALLAREIGREEHCKRTTHAFNLTRALLLQYVQDNGQFDPAGSTEGKDEHAVISKHVLPMRSMSELVAGLDAMLTDHLREGNHVHGYTGPLPSIPFPSTSTHTAAAAGPAGKERRKLPQTTIISRTTLQRVIDSLEKHEHVRVSITQTKGVCRCDDCEKLDQQRKKLPANSLERQLVLRMKREHLTVAARQRAHFNDKKTQAISNPQQLWTITFDGFDQSKTQLPHRPRSSKFLDSHKRGLLGVHVVGVFAFGAPLPVMAFFNDATVAKDSSLSTTIMFEIIDKQWRHLMNEYIEASQSKQLPGAAARVAGQAALLEAASRYATSKWPRQLHLTFDNAGGEAKNQFFFRAVGALVHRGVFEAITLSTLLVGHTHDIVDQMFSVWAVKLRITCVHTLSKLKEMFRSAYNTRIKALTDLLQQYANCAELDEQGNVRATAEPQPSEHQLHTAGLNLIADIHEYCAYNKAQQADVHALRPEWSLDYVARLQSISHELHTVAPQMYDVPFAVDIEGWLKLNKADINCEADMSKLQLSHVFGIEKDPSTGNTYLYNSFLVDSVKDARETERHHYPKQLTGSYSARSILFNAASQFPHPPRRKLAVAGDFALHRQMVEAYNVDHLDPAEHQELLAMIDAMEQRVLADSAGCSECRTSMAELQKVGVISRKIDQTQQEKEHTRAQTNRRNQIKSALNKHLADPAFAETHQGLVDVQWWSQWEQRSRDFIQPEYLRRSNLLHEKEQLFREQMPYHVHPLELCSGVGEPPIFETSERVDCKWLFTRGKAPAVGDIVVLRSQEPNEAFMVGKIKKLLVNEESDMRKRQAVDRRRRVMDALSGFDEGISRARAQPLHPRNVELHAHDQTLLQYMGSHKPGVPGELPSSDMRKLWRTDHRCYEVRASRQSVGTLGQPCSLGLFAVRDIAVGEPIDWYSIYLTDKDELRASGAPKTHACSVPGTGWALDGWPLAEALPRYVAHSEDAQVRMLTMPASYFHPRQLYGSSSYQTPQQARMLERYDSLPKGSLANSGRVGERNCRIAHHACARELACLNITELPYLLATRPIKRGEELLSVYRSHEERTEWEPSVPVSSATSIEMDATQDASDDDVDAMGQTAEASIVAQPDQVRPLGQQPRRLLPCIMISIVHQLTAFPL